MTYPLLTPHLNQFCGMQRKVLHYINMVHDVDGPLCEIRCPGENSTTLGQSESHNRSTQLKLGDKR